MESSDQSKTELILPDDGRYETRWLMLSIVFIIFLAGVVLQYNQYQSTAPVKHLALDAIGKAVLTSLMNAADEIQFLSEAGEAWPEVSELIENETPPFSDKIGNTAAYTWKKLSPFCYLGSAANGDSPQFLMRFINNPEIYWHMGQQHDVPDCTNIDYWQKAAYND
jgi:hypothetical protein